MTGPAFRTCGVRIDALNLDQATDAVIEAAVAGRPAAVHLCNAYTMSLAVRDPAFAARIDGDDYKFMDGAPLVWAARRLGYHHCTERVYGPDLMLAVMDQGRERGLRHFLYGSTPEVIEQLTGRLSERLPGLDIVGTESPPFRALTPDEERATVTAIQGSEADLVWVGLGTPRQDDFVQRFRSRIGRPLVAVGAAFDFHAGAKRQAPAVMQRAGLEWLYRLATEPRRLWKRYLIGNPVFLYGMVRGVRRDERPAALDAEER